MGTKFQHNPNTKMVDKNNRQVIIRKDKKNKQKILDTLFIVMLVVVFHVGGREILISIAATLLHFIK